MALNKNILLFNNSMYGKIALGLGIVCSGIYMTSENPANGGTWQGYTLGTLGALIIVWLTLLGIRKRSYRSSLGTVQGWTSAHVYLGLVLLLIGTLHCGYQFGWNIHTLAYVLMVIVIVSGMYGLWLYLMLPSAMESNRKNLSRENMLRQFDSFNQEAVIIAADLPIEIQNAVGSAIKHTTLGGGTLAQIRAKDSSRVSLDATAPLNLVDNRDQKALLSYIAHELPKPKHSVEQHEKLQALLDVLSQRKTLLNSLRLDMHWQTLLHVWLVVHIPFSIALLGVLTAHIISVFFYW
ncbi:MAG: hypothetical protein VB954_01465 [Thalassolituus sp.]|uniref:Uncharacterized protein n=1 Tax=Thalassolituus oleivorans MIL-1 TaxID=1298593 RepID=M5DW57_9GAMM|nr:hypothetical protein [Thalassolituus oleivorans]MDF1640944.1 hypothetical protein [Thalassolituus oleivorans]CCU74052.1 hypothetical protein TOL_3669 [Thalassolituus oleivorans MIL-1]